MSKCKVNDEALKELAEIYNEKGKPAVYELLRNQYEIRRPIMIFHRMQRHPDLSYDKERDMFSIEISENSDKVFMSMEELCTPIVPQRIGKNQHEERNSRPIAMDKLINELIGDRLLELSRYVTIDPLSKRIIIDKTTLTNDGYQLLTH